MKLIEVFINQVLSSFSQEGIKYLSEYFIVFSRFEGALKSSFVYCNKTGDAKPDWNKYEAYLKSKFDSTRTSELNEAVSYMLNYPPKIQTIEGNMLGWRPRIFDDNIPEINKLGQHIRDVRNNLFHGSKFNDRYDPDTSRDLKLIKYCYTILDEWLFLSPELEAIFNSNIP